MDTGLLAVAIFAAAYAAIVFDLTDRAVAVLVGALAMVGLGVLSEHEVIGSIHWEALGLIFGMFVLVAALSESGFFRWIGLHALRLTRFNFLAIFIVFCAMSAVLAAFMDSITVMAFMASLSIEVCALLKVKPLPLIIAEICSANIGGAATMVGDPPNVIIGTALNLSFMDFVTNTGLIAVVAFAVNLLVFGLIYRKELFAKRSQAAEEEIRAHPPEPSKAVSDWRLLRISLAAFAVTVTLLVLHSVLDLLVAFVAIFGACMVLVLSGKRMAHLIDHIDWHTMVFLAGLFVMVGGLESAGVLDSIADALSGIGGGTLVLATLLLWSVAILSAVLDNVPLAAAMVPVIRGISADTGIPLNPLAYTLALGCDIGGNATPIGASANVVGLAVAEKAGETATWKEYCKVAVPATAIVLVAVTLMMMVWLY